MRPVAGAANLAHGVDRALDVVGAYARDVGAAAQHGAGGLGAARRASPVVEGPLRSSASSGLAELGVSRVVPRRRTIEAARWKNVRVQHAIRPTQRAADWRQ